MIDTEKIAKFIEENSDLHFRGRISRLEMESAIGSLMHPYELKEADLKRISESLYKLVRKGRVGR